MVSREVVQPGLRVRVTQALDGRGMPFELNAHEMLFGRNNPLAVGETLEVLTRPRKRDNINLVRVRRQDGQEGEVFYTHLHFLCDVLAVEQNLPRS